MRFSAGRPRPAELLRMEFCKCFAYAASGGIAGPGAPFAGLVGMVFMGGALAFAFVAPTAVAISVFLALGLGLALPFLAIGFVPALARRLPRPGAWMEALKQALAFPMYLTAVWLLWVLGQQRGVDALGYALAGIVVLALALWRWEKARWGGGIAARVLALALLAAALWLGSASCAHR